MKILIRIFVFLTAADMLFCSVQAQDVNAKQTESSSEANTEDDSKQDTGEFVIRDNILMEYHGHDTKVVVPEGVICIGDCVFMENGDIAEVILPEGVEIIDEFAFYGCTSLERIHLPNGLRYIAENAFGSDTSLTRLVLPEGLEEIREYAFVGCTSLEDVQIPTSLHSIGERAFSNCQKLRSIDLSTVKFVSADAFQYTNIDFSGLEHLPEMWHNAFRCSVYWEEYGKGEKENTFWVLDGVLLSGQNCRGEVEIPETVTRIAAFAFENNEEITSVTIPNTVTVVELGAFSGCKKLRWVKMADSEVELGESIFSGCSKLSEVRLSNKIEKLPDFLFENCHHLTNITLPGKIKTIGVDALPFELSKGKTVTVPLGIRKLDGISKDDVVYVTDMDAALKSPVFKEAKWITVKELALNDTQLTLHVGEKYALRFNSGAKAAWKSSRRSVATVGQTGNIYAKKLGTTVITAMIYGKEYTCRVKVVKE